MTFKRLAEYFQKLEETSSRLAITEIMAELFREADQLEIDKIVYLSLGRLVPDYEGVEFQMAEKMVMRAMAKATGLTAEQVLKKYKEKGDLGVVAQEIKNTGGMRFSLFEVKNTLDLTVTQVYNRLMDIARDNGAGSQERKIDKLAALIEDLDALSVRYIVRIPIEKLRLGFSEMTILDALSWMETGNKSRRGELEIGYNILVDIGRIACIAKEKGAVGMESLKAEVGIPILPALCQRLGTAEEMIEKLGKMAVEPKYDGTRLQVHFKRGEMTRIFTRNMENVTHMFPEIVEAMETDMKANEVILDGEGVGIDQKTGRFLPFQETIKRKRKHDVDETAKEIPLRYCVFDVMYKDGESLIDLPLSERRRILEETLSEKSGTIKLSPQIITENVDELRDYHEEQIENGLEGVVMKKWHGKYGAGRRGYNWVKFKQEETKAGGGLADTMDCVVMGYYVGRGKRADFGIGGFLVGVRRSQEDDEYVTVSKIGTGLSDEQWREMRARCEKAKAKDEPKEYSVNKLFVPDVWVEPQIVVEIQADNITISPTHTGNLALRFPRLKRFRDDKSPEEATTIAEVKKLYEMQKSL